MPYGRAPAATMDFVPLKSVKQINDRLDVVEHFFKDARDGN